MTNIADERKILSKEEIFNLLPNKEHIHTFRQSESVLVGADWDKKDIIKAINKYEFEVTGEQAQSMGHGMAFLDEYGWVFVETK